MGFILFAALLMLVVIASLFLPRVNSFPLRSVVGGGAFSILVLATGISSYQEVSPATVGVQRVFSRVVWEPLMPGPNFIAPWAEVSSLDTAQLIVEIKTDPRQPNSSVAMTRDEIPLTTLDVGLPYQLNPMMAPQVFAVLRDRYDATVLLPAAHSAVREAATRFTWREATTEKREEFRSVMRDEFSRHVQANLVSNGLSEAEARAAFVFPAAQLRAVLPPQRILSANAEKQAATVDLERQAILTQIAEQQAQRRTQEGNGIKNLFDQLPPGYSADDVLKVLSAVALKEQADAMSRAVEEGKINMMVLPMGTPISPTVHGSHQPTAIPAR